MARELSPGLKILWVWTLGTAAILVTSVVRTRMRDMENLINTEPQQQPNTATASETVLMDAFPQSTQRIPDDKP